MLVFMQNYQVFMCGTLLFQCASALSQDIQAAKHQPCIQLVLLTPTPWPTPSCARASALAADGHMLGSATCCAIELVHHTACACSRLYEAIHQTVIHALCCTSIVLLESL